MYYTKGTQIPIADTLSRDCEPKPNKAEDDEQYSVQMVLSMTEEARTRLIKSTKEDLELQLLNEVVKRGWPTDDKKLPESVKKYANFKEEITYDQGLLFKAHKVIVPKTEIAKIVKDLHTGHVGIVSSLARARQSLYWYGQGTDIKNYIERCSVCQQTQKTKVKEPILQKTVPDYPFQTVSTDLFHFGGHEYILIADHYSGYMDFRKLKSTTSSEVILMLRMWFSTHGIPEILESDGGPQFTAKKFSEFANSWKFEHRISSPHYPKSNGFAERNVQTAKNLLKRCFLDNTDVYQALLMLRNTPRNNILQSPNQRLFSRNTRTTIPISKQQLQPKVIENVSEELTRLRLQQKRYADRVSSPTKALKVNDKVTMQTGHREWKPAKVVEKTQYPRSVIVETAKGNRYRRNTHHLRKTKADIKDPDIIWPSSNSNAANENSTTTNDLTPPAMEIPSIQPTQSNETMQPGDRSSVVTRSGRVVKPIIRFDPSNPSTFK